LLVIERSVTTEIGKDLQKAAALLRLGLVVAIPTETVYGLAANALDPEAVTEIFAIKDRPFFDPLIVHSDSREKLAPYVESFPGWALSLTDRFWPGPLTVILHKRDIIPDLVTAGHPTVGVRIPDHPLTRELLSMLDIPLAAPSANPFGYVSPTTPEHVRAQLGGKISYILDGGPCTVGLESTIVAEIEGQVTILRLGGLSIEAIEEVIGRVHVNIASSSNPANPGSLESHYAPRTLLLLDEPTEEWLIGKKVGALRFQNVRAGIPEALQIVLSPNGDLREAARNFFGALRTLDELGLDVILAQELPEVSLGRAINDRLRRASAARAKVRE
jgi:L-threonylcarbamoyladenylate synthase